MNGQGKSFSTGGQRGNAMIYVLVVVALFGALSFVLARQTDTSESGVISEEQAQIFAGVVQQTPLQIKQAIEQMLWTGSSVSFTSAGTEISLTPPYDPTFNNAPVVHKLFHPQGGGVTMPRLPDEAIDRNVPSLTPGWYIRKVNNIDWTQSPSDDIVMTAYQIREDICRLVNEQVAGTGAIPVLNVPAPDVLIYASGTDFTTAQCPAGCEGLPALCVEDSEGAWSFYSILADE